jgi:hypothetical protein
MPRFDVRCAAGHESDVITRWDDRATPCPTCGAPTERIWTRSAAVRGDDIPGGFYDPNFERQFYTWSEHDRAIKEAGLVRKVKHVGTRGSDKSELTQRWDTCPAALLISEEDRIASLRAFDERHGLTADPRPVSIVAPEPEEVFTPEQREELARVASRVGF